MIWFNVALALHLFGAVLWVGGMAFALLVLRPSLAPLPAEQRMAVHLGVFRRFFLVVWHAMPVVLLTGYAMLIGRFGGFAGVPMAVHVMHLFGLVMAAVFLLIVFGPWRRLRAQPGNGAGEVEMIRRLVALNLLLGTLTVLMAAWAQ
jgi:uncharacterized membrane protein